ncbi:MAG: hypothetical protein HYX61_00225 [Gammaproteobacteria bacterium]|jgi:hypothetical protein|nr:hypothetical protein [Gammaproteobacteria bacterium]
MLTFLTEKPISQNSTKYYREVALDTPLQWLDPNAEQGFKVFGVSAGVVFVVYDEQTLVACQHWGLIPASNDTQAVVSEYVDKQFSYLENVLKAKNTDLAKFTIYAVGAQESSQNLIDELRHRNSLPFNFNTNNLHLVHGEDTFDFYARLGSPIFMAEHHKEEVMELEAAPTMLIQYAAAPKAAESSNSDDNTLEIQRKMNMTYI